MSVPVHIRAVLRDEDPDGSRPRCVPTKATLYPGSQDPREFGSVLLMPGGAGVTGWRPAAIARTCSGARQEQPGVPVDSRPQGSGALDVPGLERRSPARAGAG